MVSMAVGVSERRWRGRALRWFALVLALGSGLGMATALENWGDQAARWAMDRLIGRPPVNAVGMSNAPQLGLSVDPSASASRVLRIEGPVRDGHLRGAAFDTYAQRRWLPPVDQRTYRPIDAQQLRPQVPGVRRLTVTRLADELELVYAPLSAAGVVVPQDSDMQVDNTGGFTLLGDAESGQGEYRYEVVCARDEDFQGPLCVPPTREQLARCLHVPQDLDPRVRELARPFMKEREPLRRIFAITSFLGTNNSYSLRVAETPGEPISDFLLNKRAGYCQYFASAAVVLLRLSGLPARYVSGYYAHESAGENITIVRQRDAHAWAECWVEGVGWVTVEATPADGRPDQTQPPATSWRKLWEWTQDQWRALRQRLAAANLRELVVVVPCAAVLVLCAQLVRGMIRRRRMTRRATEYAYPTEELAVLARRFQALLVRWGLPCPESRTWQEHLTADAHGDENGAAGQLRDRLLARQFVEEYSAIRFGRAGDPAVAAAGLRYLLDQLQQPNGSGAGGAGGGVAAPSARCPLMQLQVVEVGARRDARDAGDSEDLP
jgi:transglutaminase-like putative cysteine protease